MKTLLLLIATSSSLLFINSTPSFQYSSESMAQAEKAAKDSGKSILLYYTADDCSSCQIMEQSLFSDAELLNKMNEKYITVAINRDEKEAARIVEKYLICCLPSLQIISPSGIITSRANKIMTRNDLDKFLGFPVSDHSATETETASMNVNRVVAAPPFKPGRVEVKEHTYAEMKALSVKHETPSNDQQAYSKAENNKYSSNESLKNQDSSNIDQGISSLGEKKISASNNQGKTNHKIIRAGRLESDELVKATTETMESPASTYVESNNEETALGSSPKVNEKVAEDMINILSNVEKQPDGQSNSKFVQINSESSEMPLQKVKETEKVSIKTIKGESIKSSTIQSHEYIQAGAFRNVHNAIRLKTNLRKNVQDILILEASKSEDKGQTLYKVLLGPIQSSHDKDEIINVLSKQGIDGFSVVI